MRKENGRVGWPARLALQVGRQLPGLAQSELGQGRRRLAVHGVGDHRAVAQRHTLRWPRTRISGSVGSRPRSSGSPLEA